MRKKLPKPVGRGMKLWKRESESERATINMAAADVASARVGNPPQFHDFPSHGQQALVRVYCNDMPNILR
jgi:hypothetical protein